MSDEDNAPVTLDLHPPVALRGRDEKHGITEMVLTRSTVSGPPLRLCTDRRFLVRAVKLGFDRVDVLGADKPLACRDGLRIYLWMPLDATAAIAPTAPVPSSAAGIAEAMEPDRAAAAATPPVAERVRVAFRGWRGYTAIGVAIVGIFGFALSFTAAGPFGAPKLAAVTCHVCTS